MDPPATEDQRSAKEPPPADRSRSALREWLKADAFGLPRRWLVAAAAVAIVAAFSAVLIGRQIVSRPSSAARPPTTSKARPSAKPTEVLAPVPHGFKRIRDTARGLSISLPSSWQRLPSPDLQVSVLATGNGASMLMRTADLGVDIAPDSVGGARKITDNLVKAAPQAKVIQASRVSVGGLPGYLYLYTYHDAATGERGGHAHYFLFHHQTMITLVFQVLPSEGFAGLAPLFDQIGRTLRASDSASGQSGAAPAPAPPAR